MWRWFGTLVSARRTTDSDAVLHKTIAQLRTCRGHLAMLMEECRLAHGLLEVTETEIEAERRRSEQARHDATPMTFTKERRQHL